MILKLLTCSIMRLSNRANINSQLSDLNRVPARYEGAALPGELSWHIVNPFKKKLPNRFNYGIIPDDFYLVKYLTGDSWDMKKDGILVLRGKQSKFIFIQVVLVLMSLFQKVLNTGKIPAGVKFIFGIYF